MKEANIGKIVGLMVAAAIMAAPPADAAFSFTKITNNGNTDVSSQLYFDVSVSGQKLLLTFHNKVGTASSITDIYFDTPPAGGVARETYITGLKVFAQSSGVSFSPGAHPKALPGQNGATPGFVSIAGISADSDSPVMANGINTSSEWLTLAFTLSDQKPVAEAIAALNSGAFRVGLHVQAIGTTGGSDSYVSAVPEPTTMIAGALLLLPFAASTIRILRKNRAA